MSGDASLNIVILGLSITSSWGNGHATTYRGLVRELSRQGHHVLFLERDVPWYANQRDLPEPPYGQCRLYRSLGQLNREFARVVRHADAVIVGSYVPDGVEVGRWVLEQAPQCTAFYDIDTPVTLEKLAADDFEYIDPQLVAGYDLYLSFTGGPMLSRLQQDYGAKAARALYCSVDPALYHPGTAEIHWDLGYLGTYSDDRQPKLDELLFAPARRRPAARFMVAGAQYPDELHWPANVGHVEHLPPAEHREFYNGQRYTLNVTRAAMSASGYAPSVRLFEAAACGVPVISDRWPGIETLFTPGEEIFLVDRAAEVENILDGVDEDSRRGIGRRARERALAEHTSARRAGQLIQYLCEAAGGGDPAQHEDAAIERAS